MCIKSIIRRKKQRRMYLARHHRNPYATTSHKRHKNPNCRKCRKCEVRIKKREEKDDE